MKLLYRALRILLGVGRCIRIHHQQLARLIPHVPIDESHHGMQQECRTHRKYKRRCHLRNHQSIAKRRRALPGHTARGVLFLRLRRIDLRRLQRREH